MAHQLNLFRDAAVVIGGVNMDIWGRPAGQIVPRDSNPGSVTMTPGGVGRNIAHDLCLQGLQVSLVAALGDDMIGRALLESCQALGMDMSLAPIIPGQHSSTYLFVTDGTGDMQLAINDMDICRALTPERLEPLLPQLNGYAAMVLDANLPMESIALLCRRATVPIYADTVSAAKCRRLRPYIGSLRAIKTNAMEAAALTGENDPERAARAIAAMGAGRVFVSMGTEGMLAVEGDQLLYQPVYETQVVNTTGAGDAAAAAIVWADLLGLDLGATAQCAQLAGSITCRSSAANNPDLALLGQLLDDG